MPNQTRKSDDIGLILDYEFGQIRKVMENELFKRIKRHPRFQQLIQSAQGASYAVNERLAQDILEATYKKKPTAGIIKKYSMRYIYPNRRNTK